MTMLIARLSSRRVQRNSKEWHTKPTASADGVTVESYTGRLMPALAKALIKAGHDQSAPLSAERDGTPVFRPLSLAKWASGSAGKGQQPEALRKKRRVSE